MSGNQFEGSTVRHGTASGYRLHSEREQDPCDACARAKSDYDARWRAAPFRVKRSRLDASAQRRALQRLAKLHPTQYQAIYAEEKRRAYSEAGIDQ